MCLQLVLSWPHLNDEELESGGGRTCWGLKTLWRVEQEYVCRENVGTYCVFPFVPERRAVGTGHAGEEVTLSRMPPPRSVQSQPLWRDMDLLPLPPPLSTPLSQSSALSGEKSHTQLLDPAVVLFLGSMKSLVPFVTVSPSSRLHWWIQLVQLNQGQGVMTSGAPRLC